MSIFPMPWQPKRSAVLDRSGGPENASQSLQQLERRCAAAERELERVIRESEAEAETAASAIARLSADLTKHRARADEFEQIMRAMEREFAILNATASTLAERSGVSSSELIELKQMWAKAGADPDHAALGLHQSAADFLVRAARTAFRKAHHPDTKPDNEKIAAETMFKRNEEAFERLFQMRGMSQ